MVRLTTITFRIRDWSMNLPVSGVVISGPNSFSATTNVQGTATFTAKPSLYTFTFSKGHYTSTINVAPQYQDHVQTVFVPPYI
eukprot:m.72061 g.72061  ORF g.72061 m.72061 type:complete len:83 (+) comp50217_c0_seq3:1087-1335(+)